MTDFADSTDESVVQKPPLPDEASTEDFPEGIEHFDGSVLKEDEEGNQSMSGYLDHNLGEQLVTPSEQSTTPSEASPPDGEQVAASEQSATSPAGATGATVPSEETPVSGTFEVNKPKP